MSRAVFEKVGNFYKTSKPTTPNTASANGFDKSSRAYVKQENPSNLSGVVRGAGIEPHNSQAYKSNSSRIEVAISFSQHIDPSSYFDATRNTESNPPPSPPVTLPLQVSPATQAKSAVHTQGQIGHDLGSSDRRNLHFEISSDSINRDEYVEVAKAPELPHYLSVRKGQHAYFPDGQGILGNSLDQRQRGDAALEALDKLSQSIFSAVGSVIMREPGYDHVVSITADEEVTMTGGSQQKMHGAITKVIGLGSYDKVPLETLLRIMKLSEGSFKHAVELDLRVDESWDEAAVEAWVEQLAEVDTALKAARTCLRLLAGGREDRQLYSESTISRVVAVFKAVLEDVIVPLVELRNNGPSANLFKMIVKQKKAISSTFSCLVKLFALFAELVTKIELSETVVNTLEYVSSKLIFIENAYYERDSAIGVQKFDGIRSVAMDMLCQIFLIKPEQRQGIIDDILTSLEKLPLGKQSSRQFKLADGGNIQPVSALIMRLVQASSGRVESSSMRGRVAMLRDSDSADADGDPDQDQDCLAETTQLRRNGDSTIKSELQGAQQPAVAIKDLEAKAEPLTDTATRNASYVINFIVKRAINSTKSGDTPYRNLLDLFVDDFTTCLDSPDWPSAELLLRLLMLMMVQLFEAGKTAAPAKNMALELLGCMSAAISRLRSHVKKTASSFDGADADDLSRYLSELATQVLEQKCDMEHIVSWTGPYRATLEHLQARCSDDPHLSSAISFTIADWGSRVCHEYDAMQEQGEQERDREFGQLAYRLRMMIEDRKWLSNEYTFKAVAANQAKLAYWITLLRSPLCESFNKILNILIGSMTGDQATVRSKSLKSINQVLETDPSILDGDSSVIHLILECSSDSSTQVRDSALGLLGSCIGMRPSLEPAMTPKIIDRFQDAGVGVRKRAIKLARDIYLRNKGKALRSAIANGLLRRVQDPDEAVRDLARQMIEEVWFAPFYHAESTAASETSLTEHVGLIIQTVKTGNVTETLDKVFGAILRPKDRSHDGPFTVCSKIVANMFSHIDNPESDDPSTPSGRDALQVLTIFAKADPKLFNFEQVRLLKPHLTSFSGPDELAAFRAVTVIYKRVLPQLPTVHSNFLLDVRRHLQRGIGKISSRLALDDLIACAQVCCDLLKDSSPLANLVASSLLGIQKLPKSNLQAKQIKTLSAYSIIVGCVAKHTNLDQKIDTFRARFPGWTGDSVSRLIVDTLTTYSAPSQPLEARKAALEATGLVCQAWPRNYVFAKVYTAFQQVFQEQISSLETMILRSFKEFLITEEKRSEAGADGTSAEKKALTVMGGTNFDDVASATTQRFMKDITRIALGSQDETAFLAVEVLGSINRQGLTHPKETGVTLITLETSTNRKIAELAYIEHRNLHEKHETVVEREYVKAVQSAYEYQRDIVKDSHGATTDPFQSKLHLLMEVLKISKMKNRQRFIEKLCGQADFDLSKIEDSSSAMLQHVDYARFIVENLAYFEYQTVGEVQTTTRTLEKLVTTTGAPVAQAIESEVFNVRMDVDQQVPGLAMATTKVDQAGPNGQLLVEAGLGIALSAPLAPEACMPASNVPTLNSERLQALGAASIVLLCLWEVRTYLRRLYGMGTWRHDSKAKAQAKDLNKAPVKVQGIHGDKVWEELSSYVNGLASPESTRETCRAFVELMNVDKELQVTKEEEHEMEVDDAATPSEGSGENDEAGDRGRKRKAGLTPGGRKKRARSGSQPRKRGRPRKHSVDQQDIDDADDLLDEDWI